VACTGRETQECNVGTRDRDRNKNKNRTGTETKLETVNIEVGIVIPKFECGTKFLGISGVGVKL